MPNKHGADIQIGEVVEWHIDHKQMGVGGNTSWGRLVNDEYCISPQEYTWSFVIRPGFAQYESAEQIHRE